MIDQRHHHPAKDIDKHGFAHAGDLAVDPAVRHGAYMLCESLRSRLGIGGWRIDIDGERQDGPDSVIQSGDVPWRDRRREAVDQIVDGFMAQARRQCQRVVAVADIAAQIVNIVALALDDRVESQQSETSIEAADFMSLLRRAGQAACDCRRDGCVLVRSWHADRGVGQKFIIQRGMEDGAPGIALPAGAAAQLFVHSSVIMMGRADYQQPARGNHPRAGGFVRMFAAKPDVGAATGHRGGDGHRAGSASFGDDLGLAGMMFGVEQSEGARCGVALRPLVTLPPAIGFEHRRQRFRSFDGWRADQHRLAARGRVFQIPQDRPQFAGGGGVEHGFIGADHRAVCRDGDHIEAVDLVVFLGVGYRRAGHAGKPGVAPEIGLERDRGERMRFLADGAAFLGLQGLMQSFVVASSRHRSSGQPVDDGHVAVLDDVVAIADEHDVSPQRLHDMVEQ